MKFKLVENLQPFELEDEKNRIRDVLDIIKDIEYGYLSTKTGEPITDRDYIHNTPNKDDYVVNIDPEVTLKNKLGICQDQCILIKYLMNKMHPEDEIILYALTKKPKGHCVPCYCHNDKWYYIENCWDKEKGLHGYFDSKEELENYLEFLYYQNHKDDTPEDSIVTVTEYIEPKSVEVIQEKFDQGITKHLGTEILKRLYSEDEVEDILNENNIQFTKDNLFDVACEHLDLFDITEQDLIEVRDELYPPLYTEENPGSVQLDGIDDFEETKYEFWCRAYFTVDKDLENKILSYVNSLEDMDEPYIGVDEISYYFRSGYSELESITFKRANGDKDCWDQSPYDVLDAVGLEDDDFQKLFDEI